MALTANNLFLSILTISGFSLSGGYGSIPGAIAAEPWPSAAPVPNTLDKIQFPLGAIDVHGLIGPEDGKRSQGYEFCIVPEKKSAVLAIDPLLTFSSSPGRIGCTKEQLLCLGDTKQKNWRPILFALARLSYIEKILPHWGE
ncbi:hypothetical protein IQE94_02520 [Synechocystis sp. PCC 7339]|uniref:hypothetical protein n=1 Tax=unclassified Synechocystis TaxID=2640012 RepID=UPI001BB0054F|nr:MULTISPECIES: hypothetical protein [unclassified Synechocystis]QUS61047.1 hypothetical protein HTZ78_10455 [Synechocystis sp. PCC 7338]UAJ73229.1 hypothetical protein IQE94_02520 [Synechocystis sp. PCC 7339]